jgi:hypothetical protein
MECPDPGLVSIRVGFISYDRDSIDATVVLGASYTLTARLRYNGQRPEPLLIETDSGR